MDSRALLTLGTWVDKTAILAVLVVVDAVAGIVAIEILHQARVIDGARRSHRGGDADAARRLIHDNGQDEAVIDLR